MDIIDLANEPSNRVKKELDNKIDNLNRIIDMLEKVTDELIIHISDSSQKKVKNLTKELDDLINSVKDY